MVSQIPLPRTVPIANRETEHGQSGNPSFVRKPRNTKPITVATKSLNANGEPDRRFSKIYHYLPVELRKINYDIVRERIFGEKDQTSEENNMFNQEENFGNKPNKKSQNKRILELRRKHKDRKCLKKIIIEAFDRFNTKTDPRPFARIKIGNVEMSGLLDSGASVSVLGRECRELVEVLGLEIKKIYSNVRTAAGSKHRILGKVEAGVEYNQRKAQICFYLCPDLDKKVYLGIDFWRAFDLVPDVVKVDELDIEKIHKLFKKDENQHKSHMHELSEDQKCRLREVIKKFPSFEDKGLGKTPLEKHSRKLIEGATPVKEKHYPLSPPMQDIVYAEIDKMLKLNVIEESESAWSNRTTVVRKQDKFESKCVCILK